MKDVFVSYTSVDKKTAYQLVEMLEDNGISCFIAPRNIDAGKAYAANLMKAINECKAVILIASAAINQSEHVLNEVDVIVEKKKALLPVFIEDFELNDDYRYYLGRKQWVIAYPESIDKYFSKIMDAVAEYLPAHHIFIEESENEPDIQQKNTKTIFEYIPDRGIMINPEDHQRNVSFRTDTLINMMGGIYEKVADIADQETAESIFFSSGYVSGKNFADRIDNQWNTGYSIDEIAKKLNKWCLFDSAVGWGKFSTQIDFDEQSECLTGTLTINEAFIVDKAKKRKICGFIRGYCTGVIETLIGSVDVDLTCRECPLKNKFKCHCVFDIKAKG